MRPTPLQLYFLGLAAIVTGAWGMDASGSMWPMACGASTGMMCTAPLVRQLLERWRARRAR
ncbi:hypothetical protein [Azohydromonas caseinilytica]|uniref:Uncharacterized protein n=1 Tax=Azohydromonas caseinilytica TaxID=2728836 RepID=A0A848F5T2_9BURK|nr:hypothetical protein [Azohydromonas caseinilytica]NML13949.1 hypothetical protein [Azohydromonas caseinilytica]